jgi:glutamine synthetase
MTTIDSLAATTDLGSAAHVHQSLARLLAGGEPASWEAREAVGSYVRAAKSLAVPPEDVLVRLKRLVTIAAAATRASWRTCDEVTDRVVGWFIETYF